MPVSPMTSLEDRHCTPMEGAEQALNLFQGIRRFSGERKNQAEVTGRKLSSCGLLPLGEHLQIWQEIEPPESAARARKLRGTGLLSETGCTARESPERRDSVGQAPQRAWHGRSRNVN